MLKRIAIAVAAGIILFLLFRYCQFRKDDDLATIEYNSNLIQQQILNVGKLVVTEGHFAEVLTYKDQDQYFGGVLSFEKKALIIVNAEVTVGYDLHQMQYDIDEKNKIITIKSIPKEEIKISPDIRFYDVNQSKFNAFTGDDYNKINQSVRKNLAKKLEKSSLKSNAKNRLVSELSKMLILTHSLGWTLRYDGKVIDSETDLSEEIKG
ncbi:DUF4230 domain-containing protein [Flavobacterium sp. CYK-4]|uniref:DUF4230 domain-containing protein n=1 Tax=Flavobacterium lotistagni TaxID=2709660 RepID=UPI00140E4CAE|nr:DUF4230 domain-containing protein [Flavobacterium lotistagni]NHM05657.1 DUF4230 domain-containing protein [Flavobacterium lotistagni]